MPGPRSRQKQHCCQWPTVTQNTRVHLQVQVRYLPGNVIHGNTMLLHAILPSIIRRVSYFVRGGRCTVYPPLQEKKKYFFAISCPEGVQVGLSKTVNGTYLIWDVLISYKFPENCLSNGWSTDVTLTTEERAEVRVRFEGGQVLTASTGWLVGLVTPAQGTPSQESICLEAVALPVEAGPVSTSWPSPSSRVWHPRFKHSKYQRQRHQKDNHNQNPFSRLLSMTPTWVMKSTWWVVTN